MKLKKFHDTLDGRNEQLYGFRCPGCGDVHIIPTAGARAWQYNGNMDAPTFRPSILARYYNGEKVHAICHSFVTDGKIQFLGDCTHHLKNQIVDLPIVKP